MAVAAVLAQLVTPPPDGRQWVVGYVERGDTGRSARPSGRRPADGEGQQLVGATEPVRFGAEDPPQLRHRPFSAGGADRGGVGSGPAERDEWNDDLRVEDAERGGHHPSPEPDRAGCLGS